MRILNLANTERWTLRRYSGAKPSRHLYTSVHFVDMYVIEDKARKSYDTNYIATLTFYPILRFLTLPYNTYHLSYYSPFTFSPFPPLLFLVHLPASFPSPTSPNTAWLSSCFQFRFILFTYPPVLIISPSNSLSFVSNLIWDPSI